MRRHLATACLVVAAGCGGGERPPPSRASSLPAGTAARVGQDLIAAASVARLFEARGITQRAAAATAIADALWAQGARASLPRGSVRAIERGALARSLLESLSRAAQAEGPPTDSEITSLVAQHWLELARPPAARTTHVVVLNDKPERNAAAQKVAEKLAVALQAAKTGEEFLRIGRAFPAEGFELRAEALDFVTPDGRTFKRRDERYFAMGDEFDVDFARAATALTQPGQLSPVTKSRFGYHVIRLEERDPGKTLPPAELRELLGPEAIAHRAATARRELIERLRQRSPIQYDRADDELTATVKATP